MIYSFFNMRGLATFLSWRVIVLLTVAIQSARGEVWTTNTFSTASAAMSANGQVQIAGDGATWVSHDYGATWYSNNFVGKAVALSADGSKIIVAGGVPDQIRVSKDAGTNWTSSLAPSTSTPRQIACSSDALRAGMVFYGSYPIFVSTNGGLLWTTNNDAPTTFWLSISSSADGQRLLACSQSMGLWLSTNYGVNWSSILTSNNLAGVSCSADGKRVVVASQTDVVYLSGDFGATWTWQHVSTFGGSGAACSADGSRLGVISYAGVFISTDSGLSWTAQPGGGTVLDAIATSADGHRWLTGHSGQGRLYLGNSAPSPALSIIPTNGNVLISWTIPSSPFVVQQMQEPLNQGSWTPVIDPPSLNLNTLQNQILIQETNTRAFFRLSGM